MKKKSLFLLLPISLLLGGIKCKKNNDGPPDNPYGLPNATQIGANTFACLINGQKFIAFNDGVWTGVKLRNDTLGITGRPKLQNYFEYVTFVIDLKSRQGMSFQLNTSMAYGIYATDSICSGISFKQTTSHANIGTIQLTKLDSTNKIVSGTFAALFPIPNCDTLRLTEGRFDFHYY